MKTVEIRLDCIVSVSEILCDIISSLKERGYYHSDGHITQNGFKEIFSAFCEEDFTIVFELFPNPKLLLSSKNHYLLVDVTNLLLEKNYSHNVKIKQNQEA